jgi:hypothetical protein
VVIQCLLLPSFKGRYTLMRRILQVLGSELGSKTGYPEVRRGLPQFLQADTEIISHTQPKSCPYTSPPIQCPLSSYKANLHSASREQWRSIINKCPRSSMICEKNRNSHNSTKLRGSQACTYKIGCSCHVTMRQVTYSSNGKRIYRNRIIIKERPEGKGEAFREYKSK